jgi:actin-related protein 6
MNAYNDLHPLFEEYGPDQPPSPAGLPMECLLVIDSGFSCTTVTPVFKGRSLQRAVRRLDFGGKHFTNLLKETISVRHFDLSQDTKMVNDIKEDVCFVSKDFKSDLEKTWKGSKKRPAARAQPTMQDGIEVEDDNGNQDIRVDYILPDGINFVRGFARPHDPTITAARKGQLAQDNEVFMTLGNERFTVPEILFNPSDIGSQQPGIADTVLQSLSVLPPLVQATLLSNVLVVGGNAKISGFIERLHDELRGRVRSEWAVRVRRLNDPLTSSWLGGARLASRHRHVVKEYGVTREQYLENGSSWMARRFLLGANTVK